MKTNKRLKHIKQIKAAAPAPETKPKPSDGSQVIEYDNPPPEYLLEEAMKEQDRKLVEDYIQTIRVLRNQKRFTFREISEWLKHYGIDVDHNAVYRAYTKNMDERDAALVAMNDEEAERNGH